MFPTHYYSYVYLYRFVLLDMVGFFFKEREEEEERLQYLLISYSKFHISRHLAKYAPTCISRYRYCLMVENLENLTWLRPRLYQSEASVCKIPATVGKKLEQWPS